MKTSGFDSSSLEAEMSHRSRKTNRTDADHGPNGRLRGVAFGVLAVALTVPSVSQAQLDICGCAGAPSLGAFDSSEPTSYPPGTTFGSTNLTIPLPDDGILIFDSFRVSTSEFGGYVNIRFEPNAANTPVTLLVKGDVTIASISSLNLDGEAGTAGSSGAAGIGGLGGPGGFRGGDGAFQLVNAASDGGEGFGPGGGAAGTALPLAAGLDGSFYGALELQPPVGGSGGGGGASSDADATCSGGGGGGGGGGLLVAANGTITVDGALYAQGGSGGSVPYSSICSSRGGSGSGGAIRLMADAIGGAGYITAGAIRMESLTNTFPANNTVPAASRVLAPGPVANPLTPTVAFTAVNGETQSVANGALLSQQPQGVFGIVDVILAAPGVTIFDLATSGVPAGTTVEVTAKPRVGGAAAVTSTTLVPASCNGAGDCVAAVALDLDAGAYVVEALATFATP